MVILWECVSIWLFSRSMVSGPAALGSIRGCEVIGLYGLSLLDNDGADAKTHVEPFSKNCRSDW